MSSPLVRGVLLVAAVLVLASRGLGTDVYEGGEAREALVARKMLETGDWILPLWNGRMIPSKPPLFHWLIAAGAGLTGGDVTERTLRAPSVVLAGVTVLMVFAAGTAWGGPETGTLAAVVLATSPQFLREAGHGRVDMTLLAPLTAAMLLVIEATRRGAPTTALRLGLAAALALAMLAKGPVGPGLVGLTALAIAARERAPRVVLGLVRPLPVLLFVALAGGWYGLAYLHRGWDFVAKQIVSENGEALLGGGRFPHRSPLYYVGPLVLGGLPWTLVLPWAAVAGWRGDVSRRACCLWAVVVLGFFAIAPLKRAAYLLPLRPALALVIGWWLAGVVREERTGGRLVDLGRILLTAVSATAVAVALAAEAVARGALSLASVRDRALDWEVDVDAYVRMIRATRWEIMLAAGAVALAAAVGALALGRGRWSRAVLATAAVVAGVALLVSDVFVPGRAAQKSVRPFAEIVRERVPPTAPLAMLTASDDADAHLPLIFYLRRDLPFRGAPRARPPDGVPGYYVLDQARWDAWGRPPGWRELVRSPHLYSHHRPDPVLVRRE